MSHKRFSIVSLVLLLTLALAACGQSAPTTQAPPAAQATQPPEASAGGQADVSPLEGAGTARGTAGAGTAWRWLRRGKRG